MTKRFLVTGATGDTGHHVTEMLLAKGHAVRAFVHSRDDRSAALEKAGAELFVGDLLELDDVRRSLDGITAAYFVYPIRPGLIQATAYFAQAGAHLEAIVNMSQISARYDSKSHAAHDHWIGERVFDRSGIPVTHVRPTFFAEWLTYDFARPLLVERGIIRQPFGTGRHAPISAFDQARLITAVLENPGPHAGKIYPLFGPEEMDHDGIAAAVGEALHKKVTYQPITIPEFKASLEAAQLPAFLVQHLCVVAQDFQDGVFAGADEVIARITGTPPQTVQQFVAANWNDFTTV